MLEYRIDQEVVVSEDGGLLLSAAFWNSLFIIFQSVGANSLDFTTVTAAPLTSPDGGLTIT